MSARTQPAGELVARSQSAVGSLQASQAANQLLALASSSSSSSRI
jgi:conjugal transfer/entry exclusion protein